MKKIWTEFCLIFGNFLDWEFKNFLSVWFLGKFGQGSALFLIFQSLLVEFWKFWKKNFLCKKNVSLFWILFYFCAESVQREYWFFSKFCFPLCRVVQSAWELLVLLDFWKFSVFWIKENLARGLPYSWNFEFLFATFENFRNSEIL